MSIFYDMFELPDEDLSEAGITSSVATKAYEAPGDPPLPDDGGAEPPLPDEPTGETEPPMPDTYDADLDAANQQIEDAGSAAAGDEPPLPDEDTEEPLPEGEELPEEEISDEELLDNGAEEPLPEEETPIEDPNVEYQKKLRIHRNCKRLLAIVKNSRDSFEQKFSSKITGKQYIGYHKIINAFDDLYEITTRVLTNEFATGDYKTLIRHYVSLVKVYDIITKMTENFVDLYIKENDETNA